LRILLLHPPQIPSNKMNVEKDPFQNKGNVGDGINKNNVMLLTLASPVRATTSPTTPRNVTTTKKTSSNNNKKKKTDTFERPPKSTIPSYELLDVMHSPVAPILWLEQARKLDSYVFRLPIKRLGCPMVVLVGDVAVARKIWNDLPVARIPDPTPSPGACMELTTYKTNDRGPSNRYAGRPVQTILNPIVGTGLEDWIEDTIHPLLAEYNPITDGNEPRTLDADEDMRHLALSILGEAAFDYRLDYRERKILMDKPLPKHEDIFRKKQPRNRPPATLLLSVQRRSWKPTMARMELCGKMVQQYREKHPHFQEQDNNPRTILDLFLADPCYKTEKELLADLLAFIDTCHQSVATTLGFTLLELARSQSRRYQRKLRSQLLDIQKHSKEKKEAGKDCGDHPNWYESTRLRNAIWEGMRLYPAQAIGTGGRVLENDVYVKNMKIPKGSLALLSLFVMLRDRKVFKDSADGFQPDRWDMEAAFGEHNQRQAMVPLDQGSLDSTAQAMANSIVWHVLPRLLVDYEFVLEDEGRVKFVGALKPHHTRISVRRYEPDRELQGAAIL
jgi:cytochrome P450